MITTPGSTFLLSSLAFASQKHISQRRKDASASPYINHPIAVAELLALAGVEDVVTLQAAVLHDTIEDTATTYEELSSKFGEQVAKVVVEVTDDKSIADKAARKALQLENAPKKSPRAAAIKIADKTCNLRDLVDAPPAKWGVEQKQQYFDWARKVVDCLPPVSGELMKQFDAAYARRGELT